MLQSRDKKTIFMLCLMCLTAILITVFGIIFKQKLLNMLPLYVSLIVGILLSKANRLGSLIGGFNAILYSAVYFSFTLYANAAYALLISAPMQIITFINWSRHKSGNTTYFRKMSANLRIIVSLSVVAAWVVCYLILSMFGSNYMLLDNTVTLIGILATLLMMFSFVEYAPLTLICNLINIILFFQMNKENPAQLTYLIYAIYSAICNIIAVFSVRQYYTAQQLAAK